MTTETNKQDSVVSHISRVIVVNPGDTLQTIAKEHYGDEALDADLARVNGIARNAILIAGSKVKVPHISRLRAPMVARSQALGDTQAPIDTITVTGTRPWYLRMELWAGFAVGGVLAYLLLRVTSKRRK